ICSCSHRLTSYSAHSVCTAAATTELYTLSLHDALPICGGGTRFGECRSLSRARKPGRARTEDAGAPDRPPAAGPLTISCYACVLRLRATPSSYVSIAPNI